VFSQEDINALFVYTGALFAKKRKTFYANFAGAVVFQTYIRGLLLARNTQLRGVVPVACSDRGWAPNQDLKTNGLRND
jgi:hypothetical protein